jgi:Reverse transcriptase (RNA-dependent DNA polymerase)
MRIEQFRPISLINYSIKIITNIQATRISMVMDQLINHTQTTFIKGKNIHDNIICAQEILYKIRKNKNKGILFKIDFEKFFDSVNWQFFSEVLQARGFGNRWTKWIKKLL